MQISKQIINLFHNNFERVNNKIDKMFFFLWKNFLGIVGLWHCNIVTVRQTIYAYQPNWIINSRKLGHLSNKNKIISLLRIAKVKEGFCFYSVGWIRLHLLRLLVQHSYKIVRMSVCSKESHLPYQLPLPSISYISNKRLNLEQNNKNANPQEGQHTTQNYGIIENLSKSFQFKEHIKDIQSTYPMGIIILKENCQYVK